MNQKLWLVIVCVACCVLATPITGADKRNANEGSLDPISFSVPVLHIVEVRTTQPVLLSNEDDDDDATNSAGNVLETMMSELLDGVSPAAHQPLAPINLPTLAGSPRFTSSPAQQTTTPPPPAAAAASLPVTPRAPLHDVEAQRAQSQQASPPTLYADLLRVPDSGVVMLDSDDVKALEKEASASLGSPPQAQASTQTEGPWILSKPAMKEMSSQDDIACMNSARDASFCTQCDAGDTSCLLSCLQAHENDLPSCPARVLSSPVFQCGKNIAQFCPTATTQIAILSCLQELLPSSPTTNTPSTAPLTTPISSTNTVQHKTTTLSDNNQPTQQPSSLLALSAPSPLSPSSSGTPPLPVNSNNNDNLDPFSTPPANFQENVFLEVSSSVKDKDHSKQKHVALPPNPTAFLQSAAAVVQKKLSVVTTPDGNPVTTPTSTSTTTTTPTPTSTSTPPPNSQLSVSCIDALVAALAGLPSTPSAVTVTPLSVLSVKGAADANANANSNTQTQSTDGSDVMINTDDIFEGDKADKQQSADGRSLTETRKSVPQDTVSWAKKFKNWIHGLPIPVLILGASVVALIVILLILFIFHCVLECTGRRKDPHKYGVPKGVAKKEAENDAANDPLVSVDSQSPYHAYYEQNKAKSAPNGSSSPTASNSAAYVSTRTTNKMTQSDEEFAQYLAGSNAPASTPATSSSDAVAEKRTLSARERLLQEHLDLELGEGDEDTPSSQPTTIQAKAKDVVLFDSQDDKSHSRPYVDDDIADDSDMFT